MVFYGPWEEPFEHEVLIHAPESDGDLANPGPDQFTPDGVEWLSGSAYPGWAFTGTRTEQQQTAPRFTRRWTRSAFVRGPATFPGGEGPGYGTAAVSECVWQHAFAGSSNGWDSTNGVCEVPGGLGSTPLADSFVRVGWEYDGGADPFAHTEVWHIHLTAYRIMCYRLSALTHSQEGVVPPPAEWPTDAIGVDVLGEYHDREILETEVRPWSVTDPSPPTIEGVVKQAGAVEPNWALSPSLTKPNGSTQQLLTETTHVTIDVAALTEIAAGVPDKTDSELNTDPRLPRMAFYPPSWPGNSVGPDETNTVAKINFAVYMRFRTPAWRYVYAEPLTIPYRRNIPARGDDLAGGPTRNYPPLKTGQSGRRNVGGFW